MAGMDGSLMPYSFTARILKTKAQRSVNSQESHRQQAHQKYQVSGTAPSDCIPVGLVSTVAVSPVVVVLLPRELGDAELRFLDVGGEARPVVARRLAHLHDVRDLGLHRVAAAARKRYSNAQQACAQARTL